MNGRTWPHVRRARRIAWLATALLLLGWPALAHADVVYHYDPLGRLRGMVSGSDTVIWTYDSVGDVLSVVTQPSSQVAIIEVRPRSGPVGTAVEILGAGFSPTPGQNAVTFNGAAAATPSSASATALVVTVPAGATTGPVGVVVSGSGSATSPEPFAVTADSGAPTITSFSPIIGSPGTAVTITGTNFESTPALNTVRFEGNGISAVVGAASATSLATTVPPGLTASGPISAATPAGKAVSTQDFFLPVGSYTVADIVTTVRMSIGETKVVSIPTANKVALIIFDGTAGQKLSVSFSSAAISGGTVSLYNPDGTALLSPLGISLNPPGGFIDTKTLPATGVYSLVVDPNGTLTGNVTVTLNNVVDVTGSITPGGSAVPLTISTPGQNARLTFAGTANQRVSLRRTSTTIVTLTLSLLKPDGTTLAGPEFGDYIDAVTLPTTGTYTVQLDPSQANTGATTLTLYNVVDLTGSITVGGSAVTMTTTVPGQKARLTFTGTATQRVSLFMSSVTVTSSFVYLQKPDGSTLTSVNVGPPSGFIDTQTLPADGNHTILLDPIGINTGSVTFTLYEVPADLTGTITPGGSAVTVTIGTPGQNATLTFSGTSGQRISLRLTAVTFTRAYVSIKKPDGSTLVAPTFVGTAGAFIDTQTLGTTGTYTILVNPDIQFTGAMTLTLYDVPADTSGSLTIGGSAVTVTITTPGQNGSLTFSGTASQQVTVHVTSNTLGFVTVALKKPDGTQLTALSSSVANFNLTTQTLPTTGTYTVTINPDQGSGSLAVSVSSP